MELAVEAILEWRSAGDGWSAISVEPQPMVSAAAESIAASAEERAFES